MTAQSAISSVGNTSLNGLIGNNILKCYPLDECVGIGISICQCVKDDSNELTYILYFVHLLKEPRRNDTPD